MVTESAGIPAPRQALAAYGPPWSLSSTRVLPLSGGLSGGRVWRVQAGPALAALKRYPPRYPVSRIRTVHRLLLAAAERGFPLAAPVPTLDQETWCQRDGETWELSPWIHGRVDPYSSPVLEHLCMTAMALAQWHTLPIPLAADDIGMLAGPRLSGSHDPLRAGPAPAVRARLEEGERLSNRLLHLELPLPPEIQEPARRTQALLDLIAAQLHPLKEWAEATLPRALCLRDVHREHVLFAEDQLAGIIDWTALGIDTPAADLARYLGSFDPRAMDACKGWTKACEAYGSASATPAPSASFVRLLARSGCAIAILHWFEWLALERRSFRRPQAAVTRWQALLDQYQQWQQVPPVLPT